MIFAEILKRFLIVGLFAIFCAALYADDAADLAKFAGDWKDLQPRQDANGKLRVGASYCLQALDAFTQGGTEGVNGHKELALALLNEGCPLAKPVYAGNLTKIVKELATATAQQPKTAAEKSSLAGKAQDLIGKNTEAHQAGKDSDRVLRALFDLLNAYSKDLEIYAPAPEAASRFQQAVEAFDGGLINLQAPMARLGTAIAAWNTAVTNNLVPAWNAKPNKALVNADKDLSAANMSIAQAEADLQAAIANIQTFNDSVKNAPAMVPDASGKMVEVAAFAADAQEKSAQFRKQAADDCADMETIRTWFSLDPAGFQKFIEGLK